MKIAMVALAAAVLVGCGNVDYPQTEAEADGGCWSPKECPPGAADLSSGTSPADLCGMDVGGATCIVNHSKGLTCWETGGNVTLYFVSSCAECAILSGCR